MDKTKGIIIQLIYYPLYIFSFLVPKRKDVWIFGAWFGRSYSDNSKYLFEYGNKNTDVRCVWISRDWDVIKDIRRKGYAAYYMHSVKGIYYAIIAKVGIFSTGEDDLNHYLISSKLILINLWHGSPLKKIMHDDKITFHEPSKVMRILFPFCRTSKVKMICASSPQTAATLQSAFQAESNIVKVTGYSRNDILFENKHSENSSNKKGIYLPTHRGEGSYNIVEQFRQTFDQLDPFLNAHKVFLDVKLHFYHENEIDSKSFYSNIKFIPHSSINGDIYSILNDYDFLITDYSSIYFDFLLLDRPIIFFPYDISSYLSSDRQLYYDYNEVTPGSKAYNLYQLKAALEKIIVEEDEYRLQREAVNEVFNTYNDPLSSYRIWQEILKQVNGN